jgi:chromosome partitioning protein
MKISSIFSSFYYHLMVKYFGFEPFCRRILQGMGRVIAIANQKGGVGKTTTTVNIAASLAAAEKRVLLIDSDPQGNSSSGMGINRNEVAGTTYDLFTGNKTLQEIKKPSHFPWLDVVPARIDLVGVEIELIQMLSRERVLKRAIDSFKNDYEYILIDCPPSLGLLTVNALTAADGVLIPVQCEYYALEGLTALMNTIKLIKQDLNPDLAIEGVLLTMFDSRNRLAAQVAQEVRKYFGDKVYTTVIHRNVALSEAPSHGKPVLLYDIRSRGAQSYLDLAKEVISNAKAGAR